MKHGMLILMLAGVCATPIAADAQTVPKRPANPGVTQPDTTTPSRDESRMVDIRPKFRTGETIRFKMEMNSTSKTLVPALDDKPQEATSTQELGLVFRVKDVTDEGSTVELTFSRVKMSRTTGEGTDEFDSNQPPTKDKTSELAPSLRQLAGTTFVLSIDKNGNVTNISGGDALMSLDAFGGAGGLMPGAGSPGAVTPPAGTGGAGAAGGGGFREALGSIFSIRKGSGFISPGEEWSNEDTLDTGLLGSFKIKDKHKVKSANANEAAISVIGYIEPASSGPESFSMVKIKDSSFVGDYVWSTRQGMLRRMNMHQHVVIEAGAAGGATMTADTKSVIMRAN